MTIDFLRSRLPSSADLLLERVRGSPMMAMICDFQRWNRTSEQISIKRRRADALALIAEESVRSYPSWISELSREPSDGIDRSHYAYEHLGAGEALALVRERADSRSEHAVSYYHRAVHLGYVAGHKGPSRRGERHNFSIQNVILFPYPI
jgi:hypothetical protein